MATSNSLMLRKLAFDGSPARRALLTPAGRPSKSPSVDDSVISRLLLRFAPPLIARSGSDVSAVCRELVEALGADAGADRVFALRGDGDAPWTLELEWQRPGLEAVRKDPALPEVLAAIAEAASPDGVTLAERDGATVARYLQALQNLGTARPLIVAGTDDAEERFLLVLSPAERFDVSDSTLRTLVDTIASALRRSREWLQMQADQTRFRSIAASKHVGVLVIDSEGRVYEANDAALRSLGRTRRELEAGKICTHDQTLPEYLVTDIEAMQDLRKRGSSRPWRKEIVSRDGQVVPILVSTVPLRGEKDRYLCTVLEISPVKKRETALQVRRAEMELAAKLSKRFIHATPATIEAALASVLEEIGAFFSADVVAVYEHAAETRTARVLHSYLSRTADSARGGRALNGFDTAMFPTLIASLQRDVPFVAPDVLELSGDSPEVQWLRSRKIRATVIVPIALGGELSAFALFAAVAPRPDWNAEALPTFRVLSEMLATTVDRKRAEAERLRSERATRLVAGLSTGLINLASDAIGPALDDVLANVGAFLEADGCAIFESNDDPTQAHLAHLWSPEFEDRREEYRVIKLEPTSWAYTQLARGETVIVADSAKPGSEVKQLAEVLSPFGVHSLMLVPMMFEGRLAGFGGYVWMHRHREDLEALDPVLRLLGELIVNARERKRKDAELRRFHAGLEEHVEERTAQLNAMNHELGSFSHSVSHDLRSSLCTIAGFTQMLRDDHARELSEPAGELLEGICRTTRRMAERIDALLNLTRISRSTVVCGEVDLSAIATEIAERLAATDPGRRVEFTIAPQLVAIGEERMVRIVMEHLLGNAWKFTSKHEEAHIEVGSEIDRGRRAFFVRDDGAGFAMGKSAKLFETFQRLHHSSEFEGHGVGLATVQRIVRLHGGEVWGDGEVDCGATFWFTFASVVGPHRVRGEVEAPSDAEHSTEGAGAA